ncbi:MAG: ABC transporter permease [Dehalococcoidia bacterium]
MVQVILGRVSFSVVTVAVLLVLVFVLTHASGDPTQQLLPDLTAKAEADELRESLGLNRPLHIQLGDFVVNAVRGDFGDSLFQRRDALNIVLERLPATILLAGTSLCLAIGIGVPLGMVAAVSPGSWLARVANGISLSAIATPYFWLGMILIIVFPVKLGVLYTSGSGSWQHLILPAVTLAALPMGRMAQITRSVMLDALSQDYIRTARSKGLRGRVVVLRHGLKNAAPTIITLGSWDLTRFLGGGTVIVETLFAWPGVGYELYHAADQHDYPVIQAAVFVQGSLIVLVNLVNDLAVRAVDPRIDLSSG